MTNESLRSIASLLKLEVLSLIACLLIDDVGLQFIEHGCPLLKVGNFDHLLKNGLHIDSIAFNK